MTLAEVWKAVDSRATRQRNLGMLISHSTNANPNASEVTHDVRVRPSQPTYLPGYVAGAKRTSDRDLPFCGLNCMGILLRMKERKAGRKKGRKGEKKKGGTEERKKGGKEERMKGRKGERKKGRKEERKEEREEESRAPALLPPFQWKIHPEFLQSRI